MTEPIKILLVEENKSDQFFFNEALKAVDRPISCEIVNSGKEAIETLQNSFEYPDLIFIDAALSLMDGIECLTEISRNKSIRNIPVIMLCSTTQHLKTCRKLGVKAYIEKPSDGNQLQVELRQIMKLDLVKRRKNT